MSMPNNQPSASVEITMPMVTALIKQQFPQWSNLPIRPLSLQGIDNRTFRLGDDLLIRLPSAEKYTPQVKKEQQWLPLLAPHISVNIPTPIALGQPSPQYPWHWSIYRWIEGKSANALDVDESQLTALAYQLAQFLQELQAIAADSGPLPGPDNFYRGDHLLVYDTETRSAITALAKYIDTAAVEVVWQEAVRSRWTKQPVWVHGDISSGNILLEDNKLVAVIDFGCMAVGDPACDLVITWTLFSEESRRIFTKEVALDEDTWARARGWALWKALISLASLPDKQSTEAKKHLQIIQDVMEERTSDIILHNQLETKD